MSGPSDWAPSLAARNHKTSKGKEREKKEKKIK
jgi:hypothetical protein